MKKILSLLLISTLFISFSGCGDDDSASPSMTLNIDGTNVKITTVTGVMIFTNQNGYEARGLNITGLTSDDNYITVQITNWDFQNPPNNGFLKKKYYNIFDSEEGQEAAECLEDDGITMCDGGLLTYTVFDGGGEIYTSAFDEDLAGFIEVTASNGKKISGNFDAIITGFSNETDLHVTGTFKNVGYRVSL